MVYFRKIILVLTLIISLIFCLPVLAQNQDVVKITLLDKSVKVYQGEQVSVKLSIAVSPTWHINSNKPNDDFLIPSEITVKSPGIKLIDVKYPKAHELKLSFSEELVSVYEATSNATLIIKSNSETHLGKQKVIVILDYQACNDVSCMPPNSTATEFEIEVVKKETKKEQQSELITTIDTSKNDSDIVQQKDKKPIVNDIKTEVSKIENSNDSSIASTLENSGLLLSLIFVFLAGLALNLTPCVYPLIPITIGYFGGQAEGKTSRLVMLGLLYMLGMAFNIFYRWSSNIT